MPPCACWKILQFMSLQHCHYSVAARPCLGNDLALHITLLWLKKKKKATLQQKNPVEWYRYWRSDQLDMFLMKNQMSAGKGYSDSCQALSQGKPTCAVKTTTPPTFVSCSCWAWQRLWQCGFCTLGSVRAWGMGSIGKKFVLNGKKKMLWVYGLHLSHQPLSLVQVNLAKSCLFLQIIN